MYEQFITQTDLDSIRTTSAFKKEHIISYLQDAAELYLYEYLSEEYCNEIVSGGCSEQKVVALFKQCLLNYAAVIYADSGLINISTSGIAELNTKDVKPVRLDVLKQFKETRLYVANTKLDLLLKYLESNDSEMWVSTWKSSESYTVLSNYPIKNLYEFQQYVFINNSRMTFLALRVGMNTAFENDILPILETYNFSWSTLPSLLARHAKRIIANMACAYSASDVLHISDPAYQTEKISIAKYSIDILVAELIKLQPASIPEDRRALHRDRNDESSNFWFTGA